MPDLRYPIGPFTPPDAFTAASRAECIANIAAAPAELGAAVAGLTTAQLQTPYREDAWTVAQVVHHLADSHLNAYARFRLALTEDRPVVKPYDEKRWAVLSDAVDTNITLSLELFAALHGRLTMLLGGLAPGDFERPFLHPERGPMTIDRNVALYAWHGRHHIAHITALRERQGW
jgi:hypothetical protein